MYVITLLLTKGGNTLTHILKNPVSFHVWKFVAGIVLSILATISLFFLVTEPLGNEPLGYTFVAMTATLCIGTVMLFHRSILPYGGSIFVWPYKSPKSHNDWKIARHPLRVLDIIFLTAASTTVVLLLFDLLPRSPHWQSSAFVVSMSAMFMMAIILYGTRFLPEKLWIDKTVIISGSVVAVIAIIALGLQPM